MYPQVSISVDSIITDIIAREGSAYTDRPDDRGGPTKFGITLPTLQQIEPQATVDDLQNLTEYTARDIYKRLYVSPFVVVAAGNDDLLALLADSAVQHGVSRVRGWLASIPNTYADVLKYRICFYGRIVQMHPDQLANLGGWLNRVTQFVR